MILFCKIYIKAKMKYHAFYEIQSLWKNIYKNLYNNLIGPITITRLNKYINFSTFIDHYFKWKLIENM